MAAVRRTANDPPGVPGSLDGVFAELRCRQDLDYAENIRPFMTDPTRVVLGKVIDMLRCAMLLEQNTIRGRLKGCWHLGPNTGREIVQILGMLTPLSNAGNDGAPVPSS